MRRSSSVFSILRISEIKSLQSFTEARKWVEARTNTIIFLSSLLLGAICGCGKGFQAAHLSGPSEVWIDPRPTPPPQQIFGRALYQANCLSCHGTHDPTTTPPTLSERVNVSATQITTAITQGQSMKIRSELKLLTAEQIDAISAFLQYTPPAPSPTPSPSPTPTPSPGDNTPPMVTITTPLENEVVGINAIFQGTCEMPWAVHFEGTGVAATKQTNCINGFYAAEIMLSAGVGEKSVVVWQIDANQNRGQVSRKVRVESSVNGKALYVANCLGCHGTHDPTTTPPTLSERVNVSATQITTAIAQVGTMKSIASLKTLTAEQIAAISTYLEYTPPTPPQALATNTVPLGTRTHTASSFRSIFGPVEAPSAVDNLVATTINSLLQNQISALGRPCNRYDNDGISTTLTCPEGQLSTINSLAQMLPSTNVLRKGYTTRACNEILARDRAVVNALARASLTVAAPVNSSNVRALFDLFTPGIAPPASVLNSLVGVGADARDNGLTAVDQWRFVIYPLCVSPLLDLL